VWWDLEKRKKDAERCVLVKSGQLGCVRGWMAEWGPHDLPLFLGWIAG